MNENSLPAESRKPRSDSKFNARTVRAICEMVERGLPLRRAAETIKIHHTTVGRWRDEHPEFSEALAAAESRFVENQLVTIRAAAVKGSWQAAAWLLERRHPTEFSQPQIQIQNNVGVKAEFDTLDSVLLMLQSSPEVRRAVEMIQELPGQIQKAGGRENENGLLGQNG